MEGISDFEKSYLFNGSYMFLILLLKYLVITCFRESSVPGQIVRVSSMYDASLQKGSDSLPLE